MKELRIIIAGGRDFEDYKLLRRETLRIITQTVGKIKKENVTIVSGGARGADSLGERFANEFNLSLRRFPANWEMYGKRAGYMRNAEMAQYVISDDANGVLIACWDGKSRGTEHMIEMAHKMGIDVHIVSYDKG